MFGIEDVKTLVECATSALEEEDRYIANCFKARNWRIGESGPGICDNLNERYYQFVIWRELMKSFPWRPRTERGDYDLAFYDNESGERVAYAEIKGWWSDSGEQELHGIKRDIKGKLGIADAPGVMLILTSQLAGDAEENFCWLAHKLELSRSDLVTKAFPVSAGPTDEGDWEFAIIAFLVTPSA